MLEHANGVTFGANKRKRRPEEGKELVEQVEIERKSQIGTRGQPAKEGANKATRRGESKRVTER